LLLAVAVLVEVVLKVAAVLVDIELLMDLL
jgi:hypothetical protein